MEFKKIIGIMSLMFILMMSSVSATQIYVAEDNVFPTIPDTFVNQIYKHEQSVLGNETLTIDILRNIVFDSPQKTLITVQTLNNDNETHSYRLNANSLTGGVTIVTESFNLTPDSQNLLGVFSTINDEEVDIYLTCLDCDETVDPFDVTYILLEEESQTINTVFAPLIDGVVDLVVININMWKIVYYLFISFIVMSFIGGIFMTAFTLFKWGNEMKKKKHRMVNVFKREEKEDN